MKHQHLKLPTHGQSISLDAEGKLDVPNHPIICYIEGDGVGVDITPVMLQVVDAAVAKAYGKQRSVAWLEVFNGDKAAELYDGDWFPQETLNAIREYRVAIKGPLTTPIGGGFRSLNISLRQEMDLFVNMRPIRWFKGVPCPLKHPQRTDMVVFRDNAEDIYSGIEWKPGSPEAEQVIDFLQQQMGVSKLRFTENCGIGIKHISEFGAKRLIRAAFQYALAQGRDSVTLVHKGNIMKFTEGAFKQWGYDLAKEEFAAQPHANGMWLEIPRDAAKPLIIKDVIADSMFQQVTLRPEDYDVIATMNQNGDYLADALAAQVGGIGISPGANLSDQLALFEPTHGTVPRAAGLDKVNPSAIILCAQMMLQHIGWNEAAALIAKGVSAAIASGQVTYDFARMIEGAEEVSCSRFGELVIENM